MTNGSTISAALNLRDFGGLPTADGRVVRRGLLYRSASLDRLRRRDRRAVESLGLKSIVDLRPLSEQRKGGDHIAGCRVRTIPFDTDGRARARVKPLLFVRQAEEQIIGAMDATYSEMVDVLAPGIGELFHFLRAEDAFPVLIHCRAGKDRTGFAAAVVQMTLGVSTDDVVKEYLRTNESLAGRLDRLLFFAGVFTLGRLPAGNLRTILTAHARYIRTVIRKINDGYGGISAYLAHCGVEEGEVEALKESLLTTHPRRMP